MADEHQHTDGKASYEDTEIQGKYTVTYHYQYCDCGVYMGRTVLRRVEN